MVSLTLPTQSLQEYKPPGNFLEEATYLFHVQKKECVVVVLMVILFFTIPALVPQANAEQAKKKSIGTLSSSSLFILFASMVFPSVQGCVRTPFQVKFTALCNLDTNKTSSLIKIPRPRLQGGTVRFFAWAQSQAKKSHSYVNPSTACLSLSFCLSSFLSCFLTLHNFFFVLSYHQALCFCLTNEPI